jgi:hypothetical protein
VPRLCAKMHFLARLPPDESLDGRVKLQRLHAVKHRVRERPRTRTSIALGVNHNKCRPRLSDPLEYAQTQGFCCFLRAGRPLHRELQLRRVVKPISRPQTASPLEVGQRQQLCAHPGDDRRLQQRFDHLQIPVLRVKCQCRARGAWC